MQEELKPAACPFCSIELAPIGQSSYQHPDDSCLMFGICITPSNLAAWNRRTPVSGEVAEKLSNNYVCGSVVSDFQGPKITLRYQTTGAADAAFDAITDLIDARNAYRQARGQQAGGAEANKTEEV